MSEAFSHYTPKMYEPEVIPGLRTGDVVYLKLEDFRNVVRHAPILALLEQFEKDPNYPTCLWAVLNQPCDMVHDEKGRRFKSNLFLTPLLGLEVALRKGLLGDIVHYEAVKQPENLFLEYYRSFQVKKAKSENARLDEEESKFYSIRINELVDPGLERLRQELEPVKGKFKDPEDIVSVLKEYAASDAPLLSSLEEFDSSEDWKKASDQNRTMREAAEKANSALILKADADEKLANLCLNQKDSQGVFFYEPHIKISDEKHDLAFVILLQDMLTIKINKESQDSGALYKLLQSKRILSLTENFSDRLLNIMGNYFSKIGTDDVFSDTVLALYMELHSDKFFVNKEAYDYFHAKV